jgi:hypothetical protein
LGTTGIEVRVYGSEGALIARLVEEFGVAETLRSAKPDAVEFVTVEVPERLFPPGGSVREDWPRPYYSNLTASFADEILADDRRSEGGFADAAWVQEVINAVERSHHERGWVGLPLES